MIISPNEINKRAIEFANEWKNETREEAEGKSFWDGFFNVFGVPRRRVALFEQRVKKLDGKDGYIDLLMKGVVLVEQKSGGKDLDTAYTQAKDYFPGLKDHELPKYIIVSNFSKFRIYDLDDDKQIEFKLEDLYKFTYLFGFISGYNQKKYKEEDPVNIKAAELMGELHDAFVANGYSGHELEVFLVRVLFCLFSEDTTIFEKHQFTEYIEIKTNQDGSDLGIHLAHLFQVLNTPKEKRPKNIDEYLNLFPYVNGALFAEQLHFAVFDSEMRDKLLKCCYFDWSKISPAVFGSMFQSVMDKVKRRNLGAHYTSEKNIMKVIKSLFLDDLHRQFALVKNNKSKLTRFHEDFSKLKFLDPACGCGNFLIITYRELRLLEIEILKITQKGQMSVNTSLLSKIDVDQFYGIEYEEFPAQIAQVAMWLIDHQMNMELSIQFADHYTRLPLKKSANIFHKNALRLKWKDIIPQDELKYILGNPPFIGKQVRNEQQNEDMDLVFPELKGSGVLDYVTCWYIKAAEFIKDTNIKVGFVSTNSITQGEQVGILWNELFRMNIKIHFAHRTFKWSNEASGNAGVHVVIIGFGYEDDENKFLFYYDDPKGEPHELKVKSINPYLVEGGNDLILKRRTPICKVSEMVKGSMPNDCGHFLFTTDEKKEFLKKEPEAKKFIRRFLGGQEFIHNEERWCLWLKDIKPNELKELPEIYKRVNLVKEYRLKSKRKTTNKDAETPTLFGEIRQPATDYLAFPEVSSERRKYIPIGFISKETIASNKLYTVSNASLYLFGVLTSSMHMAWVNQISGRLESRIQYSTGVVYNNFPWPGNPAKSKIEDVSGKAQKVLDIRSKYTESSLADLYDPLSMPQDLLKAHKDLDKSVDLCYRPQPFSNELYRIQYLFDLFKQYEAPIFGKVKRK